MVRSICDEFELTELDECFPRSWRIPDMYHVCLENRSIALIEVEDTSFMKEEKLMWYVSLWAILDCMSIDVTLFTLNRYGASEQVPLFEYFYLSGN